ncbi:hypothetical protein Hanom_Chr02g00135001 [Helianthus anomalus]
MSAEKEKLKKKGIRKRKARPTGDVPRRVPSDLGSGQVGLEDFGDLFNEGNTNALTRKVSILEKSKAEVVVELKETKEKLNSIEDENVALREEVEEQSEVIEGLVDKIMEVRAQYKSMDESHHMLMEVVGNLHTSTTNENEVLKKEVEALRADKEIKDEQLNVLYTVIEHKLVKDRRIQRERRLAEEAAEEQSKPGDEVDTSNVETSTVNDVEMQDIDMDYGKLKCNIEEEIPPTPDREYSFKFVNQVDNFNDVIIEEASESAEDTPFHYSGVDDDFPTLNELF